MDNVLKEKLFTMQTLGLAVIMSDNQLDAIDEHDAEISYQIKSAYNLARVGILDAYVCWIGETPDNIAPIERKDMAAYTKILF